MGDEDQLERGNQDTGSILKFITKASSTSTDPANVEPALEDSSTDPANVEPALEDSSTDPANVEPALEGPSKDSGNVHPALEGPSKDSGNVHPGEASTSTDHSHLKTSALPVDPADWPSVLTDCLRIEFVQRGPFNPGPNFSYPKEKSRGFHSGLCTRQLSNGEKISRSWLSYSVKNNSVFCFCCKLFSLKAIKIVTEGVSDWSNITSILTSHESSSDHSKNMIKWRELDVRLKQGQTIDKTQMALMDAERKRWREVLTCLICIIQSLAERNLALRGSSDKLHHHDNGNFLKEVELIAKFYPVMENHLNRIQDAETHTHYLGKHIQNELIQVISGKILEAIVADIKQSKYFSIILDCTSDISHLEQMSIILRTVSLKGEPVIQEHFLGFVVVEETTGLNLSNVILDELHKLGIPFENCIGQAYDNGANMMGKRQGVQARLLKQNPKALCVPCGAHTLNLVVSDAVKSSKDALGFFGYVEKIFTFFSGSTQRWSLLKKHVNITVKSWSDTRWESRLQSINAIRFQACEVREALVEARCALHDPVAKVEAQALAEEVGSYRFLICCVVWCDILTIINQVNKLLQASTMQLDIAVDLIQKAESSLREYRKSGFSDAQTTAKDLCEQMNLEPVLKEKRLRSTKKHFSYEASDEPISDALKNLEVHFFNVTVDSALMSIGERFKATSQVMSRYGILLNFSGASELSKDDLRRHCMEVEKTLTINQQSDISGEEMMHEIQNLPNLPSLKMTAFELLSFLHEKNLEELFPNLWISLRVAVTLPVTVASAERSFSRLKLIKTYLRSSMSQERLSGLSIIAINHDVGRQLSYDDIIDDFAMRKCRRVQF
nr:zinc finger MYM-type protein 1-like [Misgurnus anguillicaudatus]